MNSKILIAALAASLCLAAGAAPVEGWILSGDRAKSYEIGQDPGVTTSGKGARYIRYVEGDATAFGTLMQQISAKQYQGKRVRFQAMVKTREVSNWAGLWMRVDTAEQHSAAFYNSQDQPLKGSNDWQQRSVTLDVPADASVLSFGVIDSGTGQVWIDQLSLEVVGQEVAVDLQPGRGPLPAAPSL